MPPCTTNNSLWDREDSVTPTPDPQEPMLQPAPNLAETILLMTNELCRWETPSKPINTSVKQPDTFEGSCYE